MVFKADTLVSRQIGKGQKYSVLRNNCLDFAVLLANHLLDPQSTVLPMSASERGKKRDQQDPRVVDPDPGQALREAIKDRLSNPVHGVKSMLENVVAQRVRYRTIAE